MPSMALLENVATSVPLRSSSFPRRFVHKGGNTGVAVESDADYDFSPQLNAALRKEVWRAHLIEPNSNNLYKNL